MQWSGIHPSRDCEKHNSQKPGNLSVTLVATVVTRESGTAGMACAVGHYSREYQRRLHMQPVAILHTNTDLL